MRFTSALLVLAGCSDQAVGKFNSAPDAQITSPADGATVLAGTPVTLRGAASDPNHAAAELTARWFVDDAEACAAAVPAADGTTSCEVIAPSGTSMDVRLEVTDPEGAAAAANIQLDVTPNAAPVATIASPETGGIYYSDQLVTFRGTLADAEDAPAALTAWWEDGATRLDAVEATPTSAGEVLGYALLAEGPHALELHVQDTAGNEGIATVLVDVGPPNSTPDCAITAPVTLGASESGERIDFLATVSDGDIGSNLLSVTWDSDKDGVLGTSSPDSAGSVAFSTSSLSVNTHRVTMTVADEVGATCASAITWTVGTAPEVTLETPILDEVVNEGDNLAFSAIVSDNEDVASDLWVSWESDRDGLIYEGPPDSTGVAQFFDSGLSFGDHALTVTVTDSAGLYATALGAFSVNAAPSAPTVSISPASPYTGDDLRVSIDTAASDPDGDPLTYTYAWSVDGVPSAASSSSTLPASATSNGETWAVSVTATDGLATSAPAVASTLIANTPPVAAVSLTPGSPTRATTLTCSATSTDADADTVTYGFSWTVAGAAVAASTTASDTSTLAGAFSAGDVVTCVVLANDGEGGTDSASASVTIGNTAPVVSSVTLSPGTVYTNDTLTATPVSSDADGDSLTLTYDWYVDGALAQSGATATLSGVTRFSRGQVVYVTVTADDGATTASATSSSVTVSNTAPTAPVVAITPVDAVDGDDLTCSVTTASYDADGDALTYSFDWDVDGVAYGGAADGVTSSLVDGGDVGMAESWECSVKASDGSEISSAVLDEVTTGNACGDGSVRYYASDIGFVKVCRDTFNMGCTSGAGACEADETLHTVSLTNDYFVSQTEITQDQFDLVMGYNPSYFSTCGGDCPVEMVSWHMAAAYANAVSASEGLDSCYSCSGSGASVSCSVSGNPYDCSGYRLLTEAEWENAARCGADTTYAGSNSVAMVAWYSVNSSYTTHKTAGKTANSCGLYDMSGNVWEWTQDRYGTIASTSTADPVGAASGAVWVYRGGGWRDISALVRVADRAGNSSSWTYDDVGFRLARTAP